MVRQLSGERLDYVADLGAKTVSVRGSNLGCKCRPSSRSADVGAEAVPVRCSLAFAGARPKADISTTASSPTLNAAASKSGNPAMIAAYCGHLGRAPRADRQIALAYASQTKQ